MFKKGDVVVSVDGDIVVMVLEDQTSSRTFVGDVVETKRKPSCVKDEVEDFYAGYFKLKQQDVVSNATPDNAFPVLKDGMIVTTRERGSYLVCADKVIRHDGYNLLTSYEKDGKHKGSNSKFDIVRVYSGENLYNFDLAEYVADYPEDLVWEEQKNAKAIAEIEEQVADLQEQINTLQEKLVTLREEK